MKQYTSKGELISAIQMVYAKYIVEFDAISEAQKDVRLDEVDRTPAENLAYQVGWTTLLLQWERDEAAGLEVKTPSENFKWNQLGQLYAWFNVTYAHQSLADLRARLDKNVSDICLMVENMSDDVLFIPHQRKWADSATKSAVWEVYKFIHINTVAPFGTFRTKIRKWKRLRHDK